jgi:hypothetical protein
MRHRRQGLRQAPFIAAGVVAVVAVVGFALLTGGSPGSAPVVASTGPGTVATGSPAASSAPSRPSASASAPAVSSTTSTAPATRTAPKQTSTSPPPTPGPDQRVITFVNATSQTVWPAAQADPKHPLAATGWILPPGTSLSILMPDHWNGRLWGRTGCTFDNTGSGSTGTGRCVTGDCSGHFQCGNGGSRAPETLAEFDLDAWNGLDFYDVNLDGFNLPMYINHTGGKTPDKVDSNGCIPAGCTHDLLATCPAVLQQKAGGVEVGCLGPCDVLKTDQYCCRGQWSGRANCKPTQWPVDYAAIFKKAEPTGYSYVYDDQSSVFTCSGQCAYRITFGVSP